MTLVMELALSVMVIAGIMLVARLTNSRSQPPPNSPRDSEKSEIRNQKSEG